MGKQYTILETQQNLWLRVFWTFPVYYVISSKNICWHPNSAPQCWDQNLLTKLFFKKLQSATRERYNWKSILHTFKIYLKIVQFWGQFSFKGLSCLFSQNTLWRVHFRCDAGVTRDGWKFSIQFYKVPSCVWSKRMIGIWCRVLQGSHSAFLEGHSASWAYLPHFDRLPKTADF